MSHNDFTTPPDHIAFLAKKVFGPGGEILDGAIAYLEPQGGGPLHPHTHPHDHLFLVIRGQVRIVMEGEERLLGPNEALLVPGSTPHAVWNSSQTTSVMVGISVNNEGSSSPNILQTKR